jgi:hypothetical protein
LRLHLSIDKNYVFFVVNDISNLGTDFPDLSSQFINNIL